MFFANNTPRPKCQGLQYKGMQINITHADSQADTGKQALLCVCVLALLSALREPPGTHLRDNCSFLCIGLGEVGDSDWYLGVFVTCPVIYNVLLMYCLF